MSSMVLRPDRSLTGPAVSLWLSENGGRKKRRLPPAGCQLAFPQIRWKKGRNTGEQALRPDCGRFYVSQLIPGGPISVTPITRIVWSILLSPAAVAILASLNARTGNARERRKSRDSFLRRQNAQRTYRWGDNASGCVRPIETRPDPECPA